jgi:hypothetical protein
VANQQPAVSNAAPPAASFQLKAAPVAPAQAAGSAELKNGRLSLHLSHLNPGNYLVEGITRPDLLPYRLGMIAVVDPTSTPGRQANDNKKEASAHPESAHLEIDVQMNLPRELSSLRFGHLRLLGPTGNIVLEGSAN